MLLLFSLEIQFILKSCIRSTGQHDILEEGEIDTTVEEEEEQENLYPVNGASTESFSDVHPWPVFRFDIPPRRTFHFAQQFRGGSNPQNFLKSVKWSPDGSSFLTSYDDHSLRLFYLPEDAYFNAGKLEECPIFQDSYSAALIVNEAEMVYDYCWFPYMSMLDPIPPVCLSAQQEAILFIFGMPFLVLYHQLPFPPLIVGCLQLALIARLLQYM